ncbi:hypothetical protein [Streptomyces cyaneofuscatus]|uniref:hypothetical protein n=1 Tax=Streptomyces cyaneofuscatus TaxID=66883 RepID=UPI003862D662|nr:hypothetical protein OG973_34670 [Streptomyces cyaneofuscatus]
MTTPAAPQWLQRAQALHDELSALCIDLTDLPIEERLTALAHLDHTINAFLNQAIRQAATDARSRRWSLRRIGTHLGRSHEQIRLLTTPEPLTDTETSPSDPSSL